MPKNNLGSKGVFITGTDTCVGKTVITACLAAYLLRKGKRVAVYKPVQCGNLLKGSIKSPDLAMVNRLSRISETNLFNDFSFSMAASPHLAAKCDNKEVDIKIIKNRYKSLLKSYDCVLVEGAGGLIVPLKKDYTILNLIKELSIPVLVVARAGLGTINHSSLTLSALKKYKISIIGVILNFYKGGKIEEDNKKIIQGLNKVQVIGAVPFSKNLKGLAENFEKYINLEKLT